jgi:hypothetical protein
MKHFLLLALVAHGVAAANPAATVVTLDEKELTGTLDTLVDAPGEAPSLLLKGEGNSLTLKQADILEMRLTADTPAAAPGQQAVLTLNNGDAVRGNLGAVSDTEVTLQTSYAGDLTFRRDMIASLRLATQAAVLFTGPVPEQWTFTPSAGAWWLDAGSLRVTAKGQAAASLKYPEKFRLGVDLEWKHDPRRFPRFTLAFLAGDGDTAHTGYQLDCQGEYVDLRNRQGGENAEPIGFAEDVIEFIEKPRVRLELLVDTLSGTISMLVDGRTVGTWKDRTPLPAAAASRLLFLSDTNSQELRASHVTVATWDGNLIAAAAEDPATTMIVSGPTQQLLLGNGDVVQAEHLEVKDGHAKIKTAHGDFRIPTQRIRSFASIKQPGNPPTPKKMRGDVRAWFPDGGSITFRLDALKDGKATGFSQSFGTAEFDLRAFQRIEMNLSNRALLAKRPR